MQAERAIRLAQDGGRVALHPPFALLLLLASDVIALRHRTASDGRLQEVVLLLLL